MRISDCSSDVCSSDLLFGVAADLVHRATAFETIAFGPVDGQVDDRAAHIVHAEIIAEQADERADRAGGILVLCLAEQQRRTPLEIAQVAVIAPRRPHRPTIEDGAEPELGSGIAPGPSGTTPVVGAVSEGPQRPPPWSHIA